MAEEKVSKITILAALKDQFTGPWKVLRAEASLIKKTASEINAAFRPITGTIASVVAGFAGFAAARKGLEAQREQVQALAKVRAALGENFAFFDRLEKQAAEIQSRTTFGDEKISELQATLLNRGVAAQKVENAVEAAIQASAALNISLETAGEQIAQTYGGVVPRELARAVPAIKTLTEAQLRNGDAVTILRNRFAGYAETLAQTDFGRIQQEQNKIGDVYERLGAILVRLQSRVLPLVTKLFDDFVKKLESPTGQKTMQQITDLVAFVTQHAGTILAILVGLKGMSIISSTIPVISSITTLLIKVLALLFSIKGAAVALIAIVLVDMLGIIRQITGVKETLADLPGIIGDLIARIRDGTLSIKDVGKTLRTELVTQMKLIWINFKLYLYDLPVIVLDNLIKKTKDSFAEISNAGINALAGIAVDSALVPFGKSAFRQAIDDRQNSPTGPTPIAADFAKAQARRFLEAEGVKLAASLANLNFFNAGRNQNQQASNANAVAEQVKKASAERDAAIRQERQAYRDLFADRRAQAKETIADEKKLALEALNDQFQAREISLEEYFARRKDLELGAIDQELKGLDVQISQQLILLAQRKLTGQIGAEQLAAIRDLLNRIVPLEQQRAAIAQKIAIDEHRALEARQKALQEAAGDIEVRSLKARGLDDEAALLELRIRHTRELEEQKKIGSENLDNLRAVQTAELARLASLQPVNRLLEQAEKIQQRHNVELEKNKTLYETGVITFEEAQSRNRASLAETSTQIRDIAQQVDGLLADGIFSQKDAQELKDRLQGVRTSVDDIKNQQIQNAESLRGAMSGPFENFFDVAENRTKSFKEIFANLLNDIASSISRFMASRIAENFLNFLGGGGFSANGTEGPATGGIFSFLGKLIPFNSGGVVPGSGPNVDSVPAVLTPGEFVINRNSTNQAFRTLAAINSGQLNDQIMSRLLPSLRGVHMPRVDLGRFAFNTGGLVPPAAGGKSSAGFQVVPAVVASESNMASLLAGGQNAMLSFFEKNRDTLRNMLGVTE